MSDELVPAMRGVTEGTLRVIELGDEVVFQMEPGYPVQRGWVTMWGGVSNGRNWLNVQDCETKATFRVWENRVRPVPK